MAQEVLVIGPSGTGKSTSFRNLIPSETAIINPALKSLPIKGAKSNYTVWTKDNPKGNLFNVQSSTEIIQVLEYINKNRPEIKNVILDDGNLVMSLEYIKRSKETGFQKFTDIGTGYANIIMTGKSMRDDITFFVLMHPEIDSDIDGNKVIKAATVGKLVDQYLKVEALFSIVLYTKVIKLPDNKGYEYVFVTQNEGNNTGKSPMGMFDEYLIPNDLQLVKESIINFNN